MRLFCFVYFHAIIRISTLFSFTFYQFSWFSIKSDEIFSKGLITKSDSISIFKRSSASDFIEHTHAQWSIMSSGAHFAEGCASVDYEFRIRVTLEGALGRGWAEGRILTCLWIPAYIYYFCVHEMQKWRIHNTRRRETLLLANTKFG